MNFTEIFKGNYYYFLFPKMNKLKKEKNIELLRRRTGIYLNNEA